MLRLTADQVAFVGHESFARWLPMHARKCFPAHCEALGVEGLAAFLDETVQRARDHGFSEPVHIARFVDLTFVLGSGFEAYPDHAWAREVLADAESLAGQRIAGLHAGAIAYLQSLMQAQNAANTSEPSASSKPRSIAFSS